jgi:hypothetical protein
MVAALLLPLSAAVKPFAHLSPWDWAFAGDPLVNATAPWRYVVLALPAAVMALFGIWVFGRRDIRAA